MAAQEIHVDDVGTSFELTLKDDSVIVDVSDAVDMRILFYKPDRSTLDKPAEHLTDGTDGVIRYIAQSGDLNLKGPWKIQAKIVLTTGTWYSDISRFKVYDNLV